MLPGTGLQSVMRHTIGTWTRSQNQMRSLESSNGKTGRMMRRVTLTSVSVPSSRSPLLRAAAHAGQVYKIEEYLPTPVRDWVDGKLRSLRLLMIENGILAPTRDPNAESKAVTDARDALRAAESSLSDLKHELETHKEDLEKDYGVDDVFRALKGQCISTDSGEYTYELCWLDRTTQKSKKGGGHTGMGNYVGIGTIVVDDEVPADGKGLGSGERVTLKYENGQHCWNGPNRSTMVVLACAEENEVWRVVELEKCVYQMEVGTPAVCGMEGSKAKEGVRDEL